jgi:hypothetical protein
MRRCFVNAKEDEKRIAGQACNDRSFHMNKQLLLILLAFSFFACTHKNKEQTGIIKLDVNKHYPKKEAIPIQEIADVTYISLETNDAFLCGEDGKVIYMDNDYILFANERQGDILIYDGFGATISKFNKKGQGPDEYINLRNVIFDKEKKEIYVHGNDNNEQILVYDLSGQFKRELSHLTDKENKWYREFFNYDKDHLLYYYEIQEDEQNSSWFALISRQNGETTQEVSIHYNQLQIEWMNNGIDNFFTNFKVTFKQNNDFFVNMITTDTLYKLTPDFIFEPIITRTPSIQTVANAWCVIDAETSHYRFMTVAKNASEFSTTSLFLDKRTGEIMEQSFYNADDLSQKNMVFGNFSENIHAIDNNRYYAAIPAYKLKAAYKNDELTGNLKEIATKIREDDNPVLMVVTFK